MKKIFTPEFLTQILIQIILSGIVVFYFQEYVKNRNEEQQELLKSKYAGISAESIAKKQNFINDKRDAYIEALKIVNKALVNTDFFEHGHNADTANRRRGAEYPTEIEVNQCFSKLWLYSSNREIINWYKKVFLPGRDTSMVNYTILLANSIKRDLTDSSFADTSGIDEYKVIEIHRPH